MMWMALGVVAMAWLGLYTLYMLNPDRKIETEAEENERLANVLKDHVTRAEYGPTAKKGRI